MRVFYIFALAATLVQANLFHSKRECGVVREIGGGPSILTSCSLVATYCHWTLDQTRSFLKSQGVTPPDNEDLAALQKRLEHYKDAAFTVRRGSGQVSGPRVSTSLTPPFPVDPLDHRGRLVVRFQAAQLPRRLPSQGRDDARPARADGQGRHGVRPHGDA